MLEQRSGRGERAERAPRRSAPAPVDPFFERPYEAPARSEAEAPNWERSRAPARAGVTANIKPRRKVAALFKAPVRAPQPSQHETAGSQAD